MVYNISDIVIVRDPSGIYRKGKILTFRTAGLYGVVFFDEHDNLNPNDHQLIQENVIIKEVNFIHYLEQNEKE